MKKRKWSSPAVLTVILAALVIALIIINCTLVTAPVIKTAVKEQDLPEDGNYIICEMCQVTGSDWLVSSNRGIGKKSTYCNIIGPSPYDLKLDYEFTISSNSYVFYVESVREYYSEEMSLHMTEYTVSGWDILYPVRRESMVTFPKPIDCITEDDLWK